MKKCFALLFVLIPFFLLSGSEKEKWEEPVRITLLYKGVPGRLFARIRPTPDIRLIIREAKKEELALPAMKSSSSPVMILAPKEFLPEKLPPGGKLLPYALTGGILAVHHSSPLRDLPEKTAKEILEGRIGYWEKIPGRIHSGRFTLYGTRELLPPMRPSGKGPLLIPAATPERAAQLLMLDPAGIGVFPLTFWEEKNLPLLTIGKVSPSPGNFMNGSYPLTKKLFLYLPPASGREKKILQKFYSLLVSRPFHIELLYMGLLPLPPEKDLETTR